MKFENSIIPNTPPDYSYCFDFFTSESRKDFELRVIPLTEKSVMLVDEFSSLTSELQGCMVNDVGRMTIFVPEEKSRNTSFRLHFEMPFDEKSGLSAYSTRDGVQIDRLVDLARFALARIAKFTPSVIANRDVDIVVESISEVTTIPYWKIGSDIAISCLTSPDTCKSFFKAFRVWDPLSGAWLTLEAMDTLLPIEKLFQLSQDESKRGQFEEIVQKAHYLEIQGLVVEQEQWQLIAQIYGSSKSALMRDRGEWIERSIY